MRNPHFHFENLRGYAPDENLKLFFELIQGDFVVHGGKVKFVDDLTGLLLLHLEEGKIALLEIVISEFGFFLSP